MEFKIDTKPSYSIITPLSNVLDVALTEALRQKWEDLTQSGSLNMIVDLHHCLHTSQPALDSLVALHEDVYEQNQSLVFTGIPNEVMKMLKEKQTDLYLNIAPTLVEASDIVSMELLERDLFNEES